MAERQAFSDQLSAVSAPILTSDSPLGLSDFGAASGFQLRRISRAEPWSAFSYWLLADVAQTLVCRTGIHASAWIEAR
jgi:hypothetical protein